MFVLSGFAGVLQGQQFTIATVAGGSPPATPSAATVLSIGDPARVGVDSQGNVYFGSEHSVFKVDTAGTLTRIAGTGRAGSTGDGGPATSAQLRLPSGIAIDPAGNVYVADREASNVRKIAAGGTISTVAPEAGLKAPTGLALDTAGNLYVADSGNNRILRIALDGAASSVGEGRLQWNGPQGVAVDRAGNIYVADTFDNGVVKVAPDGTATRVAGIGHSGYSGDDGPAENAALFLPTDVAVDASGEKLYIADFGASRIRVVSGGIIRSIAGASRGPAIANGVAALATELTGPTGVAVDAAGTVYFAEGSIGSGSGLAAGDFRVWRVSGGQIFAVAGNGVNSYFGDAGPASSARLNRPAGIAVDRSGNLFIADYRNHRVRRVSPGGVITTVAGTGIAGYSGDGGPGTAARLNGPLGLAVDESGNVYVADSGNQRIRKITADGMISTAVGNGNAAFFGDGGPATAAALHDPRALALDPAGNLYIADTSDFRVRRVDTQGIISTIAGSGTRGTSGDGGPALAARLDFPSAVAADAAGNVYIADAADGRVRKVAGDGTISTFASDTGPVHGMTVDAGGNVYVAMAERHMLVRISPEGASVTLAGTGECCYSGDGGPAAGARLNQPWGVALSAAGDIYLSDAANNSVRVLYSTASGPLITSVANGASNRAGAIAPGMVTVVFGLGLGGDQLVSTPAGGSELGGTSVLFNGAPGAMIYSSATQVSVVAPDNLSGGTVQIAVRYGGQTSTAIPVPVAAAAPALFAADGSGAGQALAFDRNGTANGPAHPAPAGSTLLVYATGVGANATAASVMVGGQPASVQATTGPPLPMGIVELAVRIPDNLPSGTVPVSVRIGDAESPAGVTVVVGPVFPDILPRLLF